MSMRLSTRLSIFFLSTVGLILAGFSAVLYAAASEYLHRQADERLEAALNTLVAAAEVNAEGVEWEPEERRLSFGRRTVAGEFAWAVRDGLGRRLDGSAPTDLDPPWPDSNRRAATAEHPRSVDDPGGRPWRVMVRRLEASRADASNRADGGNVHDALLLSAAVSLSGVHETLRNLGLTLAALSGGTLTLALLVGGRLCRRALRPVFEMSEAARAIAGHEFDERLPIAATGDELEDLGRAFNGLLDRRRESHDRQRRFTGDASHQLRTPLTAIQGQVDLALRQPRSIDEYQRVLMVVQSKTRHLRQIVESLLFLARADSESHPPPLETVDLTVWLRDHMTEWAGPRPDDVRLEFQEGETALVAAHPALLGELLDNLLDNACKYSEPGTPIVVRAGLDGDSIRLSVEDQGVGIEEAAVARVADPFYRTEQARSRDSRGLGLGLSVADRLARLFGGRLDVASRPGRGSTFVVVLPIAD